LGSALNVATVKPLTYMNRSGSAVGAVLNKWKTPLNRCLVICDDINLPLGSIRARRSGSYGGHNGLKSIIHHIGPEFPRLRIGMGPIPDRDDIVSFVLGNLTENEENAISGIVSTAYEILELFAAEGIDAVMNKYN